MAAGIPLLLGLTAVMATLGLVAIPSQIVPMDEMISSIILLIGLAVGVDYTLFYLRREREEKAKGAGKLEAVHIAAATSGRAVLVSGFTVIVAMAGMLLAGDRTFTSLGIGAIMVVAVAMIGSVTVVPALLAALGDKVDKGRIPFLHRLRRADGESRMWNAILDRVLRRPAALGRRRHGPAARARRSPAFTMHTVQTGTDDLPRNLEVMQVYDRMQAAFPGGEIPAVVAIQADDVTSPAIASAIKELERKAVATGELNGPVDVRVSPDKHVALVNVPMDGNGTDDTSTRALAELRGGIVQSTVGSAPGVENAYVSGMAAQSKDWNDLMASRAPIVFAFVLTLAFLLLLVTFRSIVIPIKAIILNLLSVAAAYGVLVLVFQEGLGEGLLGFESNGGITSWLPMFLFVILFGLSMDYHVFILSRVREAFDRGMRTEDAVAYGIKATAEHGHERRGRHGRRVRDLRDAELARLQADGSRPRGGDPDRRDDRPGGPAARDDEAPRQVELVPAQVAGLAAAHQPRAGDRGGEGLALSARPLSHEPEPRGDPRGSSRCGASRRRHSRRWDRYPRDARISAPWRRPVFIPDQQHGRTITPWDSCSTSSCSPSRG